MSEQTHKLGYIERTVNRNRKGMATVMGLAALYGALKVSDAVGLTHRHSGGPDKVYIAKPYDTEWTIAERAFPNTDVRNYLPMLDSQLKPDKAHAGHTIQPGDRFVLPGNSAIGTPVSKEK